LLFLGLEMEKIDFGAEGKYVMYSVFGVNFFIRHCRFGDKKVVESAYFLTRPDEAGSVYGLRVLTSPLLNLLGDVCEARESIRFGDF